MNEKISLERAKEIAEKLKKKYKFGKSTCPAWFKNTCTPMEQNGYYTVSVCIPAWSAISEEEQNIFLESFEGIRVTLRVVTPPKPYVSKKNDPAEDKGKEDDKTKKRRSRRKGYR